MICLFIAGFAAPSHPRQLANSFSTPSGSFRRPCFFLLPVAMTKRNAVLELMSRPHWLFLRSTLRWVYSWIRPAQQKSRWTRLQFTSYSTPCTLHAHYLMSYHLVSHIRHLRCTRDRSSALDHGLAVGAGANPLDLDSNKFLNVLNVVSSLPREVVEGLCMSRWLLPSWHFMIDDLGSV